MPRALLIRDDFAPYHVTARTNGKFPFEIPLVFVWQIMQEELWRLQFESGIEIHAFVLMPNHFHLLVTVPEFDLGIVMNQFMSRVTLRVNALRLISGHLFGGPYYRSLIGSARYFGHALKYVIRNPVKAGLVDRVEEYPYSTYAGSLGAVPLEVPLTFTRAGYERILVGEEPIDWLQWLNRPFPNEAEQIIKKGLRKTEFTLLIDRRTREPVEELAALI